jgi:hypothetical protein
VVGTSDGWVNCSRSSFRHVWSIAVHVSGGPWSIHRLVVVGRDEHWQQVGGCVMAELLLPFPFGMVYRSKVVLTIFVLGYCSSFLEVQGCSGAS